jgi:hypothetical protein
VRSKNLAGISGTLFGIILTFGEQMSLCKNSDMGLCSRSHYKLRRNNSAILKSPNSRKSHFSISKISKIIDAWSTFSINVFGRVAIYWTIKNNKYPGCEFNSVNENAVCGFWKGLLFKLKPDGV